MPADFVPDTAAVKFMKFEYHENNLTLMVLNEKYASMVLDFYYRNRHWFDIYEGAKPDNFYTLSFISNLLRSEYNAFTQGKYMRFFLFDSNFPNRIIGTVSFSDIKKEPLKSCLIGYKIDHNYQRKGYARRMLNIALKIMVLEYNMHRIEAYISPDNTPSANLVKKLGFLSEGTAYSYAFINGAWQDHLRFVYIS